MKPDVSDLFPGLLDDMDKQIEVAVRHHVTEKQKGQEQIKLCEDWEDPLFATLHNVPLAPDLCDRLF